LTKISVDSRHRAGGQEWFFLAAIPSADPSAEVLTKVEASCAGGSFSDGGGRSFFPNKLQPLGAA